MKHRLALLAVLLCLSIGVFVYANGSIRATEADVVFTEHIRLGENTGLEGLTVDYYADMAGALFWDSRFTVSTAQTETDFACLYERIPPSYDPGYHGVLAGTAVSEVLYNSEESYSGDFYELAKIRWDLEASTPAGQEKRIQFRLKDYCEFYPIGGTLDLPFLYSYWGPGFHETLAKSLFDAFNAYFKIPVLENEYHEVMCSKAPGGTVTGSGGGSIGPDGFGMEWCSLHTDGVCYFTFIPRSYQDTIVDTSHIPGGYGIYALSYALDESGKAVPDIQSLRTVYPLDPECIVMGMSLSADESKLLLFTGRDGETVLTVLDISTMEPLQQLSLGDLGDDWYSQLIICQQDNWMVCRISGQVYAVLTADEAGTYAHEFTVPIEHRSATGSYRYEVYAWKDGRLAVCCVPEELSGYSYNLYDSCAFDLAVYEDTGLVFHATYTSSLDDPERAYDYYVSSQGCDPTLGFGPFRLQWE